MLRIRCYFNAAQRRHSILVFRTSAVPLLAKLCVVKFVDLNTLLNETLYYPTTVIPRLTKIILFGVTFVSRNLR